MKHAGRTGLYIMVLIILLNSLNTNHVVNELQNNTSCEVSAESQREELLDISDN